jgi:hypothetical protein
MHATVRMSLYSSMSRDWAGGAGQAGPGQHQGEARLRQIKRVAVKPVFVLRKSRASPCSLYSRCVKSSASPCSLYSCCVNQERRRAACIRAASNQARRRAACIRAASNQARRRAACIRAASIERVAVQPVFVLRQIKRIAV